MINEWLLNETQDPVKFIGRVRNLRDSGMTEVRIASYFGMSVREFRARVRSAHKIWAESIKRDFLESRK